MYSKEFLERQREVEKQHKWLNDVPERKARYNKFFEGDWDLKNDPDLKGLGVDDPRELARRRRVVECLMDNFQAEVAKNSHALQEQAITTANVATFTNKSLAMIRKIWPRLFAWEFLSVIPMSGNTVSVPSIDHRYDSSGGAYAAGTSIYASEDPAYSDDLGEGVAPRKLDFNITRATVTATAKKVLTDWTVESEQDARSQYGLNIQPEMMGILAKQIEREVNRELIDAVDAAATTNTNWDSTQPTTGIWSNAVPNDYNKTLTHAIVDANTEIFNRVYEDANVMICGSTFAERLEKLSEFRLEKSDAYSGRVVQGPNLFGTLKGKIKVFKDPFYTADKAILGYKSDNWMYVGYAYLPYVPLWKSEKIASTTFTFAQGMMTRYGTYAKNGDFFATVTVT